VNNEILLPKLNFYGIQDKAGQWFESYREGKVVPVHTVKAFWESRCIAVLILNFISRWRR
jgi:hypothetical protein